MTATVLRDLTDFETAYVADLRTRFASDPGVEALIAETEGELRAMPVAPPCPAWCDRKPGHLYELGLADDPPVTIRASRFHSQNIDEDVSVSQEEQYLSDGTVRFLPAHAWIDRTDETDDRRCDTLAASLTKAAELIRELAADRIDRPDPS